MMKRLRLWIAARNNKLCKCGQPSVACVNLYGWQRNHICSYHLEPLEDMSNEWGPLNFLARYYS